MAFPGNNNDKPSTTDQVSEQRRRLLKAAAVSAPVIATLQSGAAFAAASANGCIQQCETGDPKAIRSAANDGWVRAEVTRYTFQFTNKKGEVKTKKRYDITPFYTPPLTPGSTPPPAAGDGPFYKGDGTEWSIPGNATFISVTEATLRYVLVYYDPNDAYTDATEIGPIVPLDDESNINGLTPLTHSCLCSVDPNNTICP